MKHFRKHKTPITVSDDWAETFFRTVKFHGHRDTKTALSKATEIFGDYHTLEQRTANINAEVYQNFTFETAEQLFERVVDFERSHLNRQMVVYLFGIFSSAYFAGLVDSDKYKNLAGLQPFTPLAQPQQK